ncbi:MAG: YitT family protein [Candidatus Coproplasma sp.]
MDKKFNSSAVADKKTVTKDFFKRYAIITLGCLLYSVGVTVFLEAGGLAAGGATGIALIVSYALNQTVGAGWWTPGALVFIINVPMFILTWIFFGKRCFFSTLYVVGLTSALMSLWDMVLTPYLPLDESQIFNAVTGGAVFGTGAGMIFRMGATTGGTDVPVKILRKKFRHLSTGAIAMVTDIIVVASSFFVYNSFSVLFFTVVSTVVFKFVFDWVLYGGNSAKMVYVISENEKAQRISKRVLTELDTGATFIDAEGAYTGAEKRILLCVVKPFNYPKLRDIAHEEDKNAFIIVSSAKEIYGEGYRNPDDAEV